jgi:serine/threonine-protein kinase
MPFLVMELLDGVDLDHVVHTQGPLPAERVATYFRQIAAALDKAHAWVEKDGTPRPIVHRDLKPENLFLCNREAGDPIVKVLDFGIAKVLGESTRVSQDVKGTPLYMAFEQASAGRITPQTDVWALGLIAFYLLTGRSYWASANLSEGTLTQLFGEVLTLPIDPPSQRARELGGPAVFTPELDAWFAKCVNRIPEKRFRTAGECAAALSVALGLRPFPSSPRAVTESELGDNVAVPSGRAMETARAVAAQSGAGVTRSGEPPGLGVTQAGTKPTKRSLAPLLVAGALVATGGVVAFFLQARTREISEPLATTATQASPAVAASPPMASAESAATPSPTVSPAASTSADPTPPSKEPTTVAAPAHRAPAIPPRKPASKPATTVNPYDDR